MGIFSKRSGKVPMDAFRLDESLREAFQLGEANDMVTRKKAIAMYRAILRDYPNCYDAQFNLGVVQSRNGQWREATNSFTQAQNSPDLKVVAAFARLKLLADNGRQLTDTDFPKEFRGDNRSALGVQGPCHNAANELRNRGYPCTVEGEGESCSIVSWVRTVKYTITVSDMMGMLIKNVFREEQGRSINLGDVENLTEPDREFQRLELGALPLIQAPISRETDGATYRKRRSAVQRKSGPHGWMREGRSFEEVAAQKMAYAPPGVTVITHLPSIEGIARSNCDSGSFLVCVLDGEPHAVAVLHEVRNEQISTIKRTVEGGACIFRGEFFAMPDYPLVHIGLGVPVEYLEGGRVTLSIVENLANFMEANFQDWVGAVEVKKYTMVHVYGPDFSHITTGRTYFDAEIIDSIVGAVNEANSLLKKIPKTALDFEKAITTFYQQHHDPFIWSSK
jgi:hypothetical protein